jgi:hypothetical protein
MDFDVGALLDAKVNERIEAAKKRRAARDAFQKAHQERRVHGNAARHRAKLTRLASENRSQPLARRSVHSQQSADPSEPNCQP